MHKNSVREAVQTNFVRVKYVSGKVNFSDRLTTEDKDRVRYIILQYCLMSKLAIMGKVWHCIHICENISIIPTYGDICHHNSSPNIFLT